ncbi:hypothetical protein BDN72DRAFT_850236 [Pluteus cervinus]|uniref:Uncharacterized protein n=1 Tax=Pluteus cervinus TaxID=181527 RepID=A0ACD3A5K4_9AGAR|nr:hypothetical protein BDN72DRAFT_850236 [Pluteus cervinus]
MKIYSSLVSILISALALLVTAHAVIIPPPHCKTLKPQYSSTHPDKFVLGPADEAPSVCIGDLER